MEIFNLPQDIITGKGNRHDDIFIHHYHAPVGSFKGKSVLHTNAISLVISGTKTMHFAGKTVNIQHGEFHFLSAGNCIVTMDLHQVVQFESVLIFFSNKTLADFYSKYQDKIAAVKKSRTVTTEPYIAFKKDDFVNNYIASLKLLFRSPAIISREMQLLKFEELMLHLLEVCPLQLLAFPLTKNRELEDLEIRKAVELNITNNISLDELAFICNLSLSTFKRRFTDIYDMPPGKWLLQKRMELAGELILKNGERPGEVYHKVGYENHSSFSQSFKQHFGVTPKAYSEVV
ncbi:helix-turn-helix domain-containing protein [Mucilaginibacter sp. AW1-3]